MVDSLNGTVGTSASAGANGSSSIFYRGGKVHMNKARGSEVAGFVTDAAHIRAALIVLLHHSLVSISGGGKHGANTKDQDHDIMNAYHQKPDPTSPQTHYTYTFLHERARFLPRFAQYIEHAQHIMDNENAAHIVECLLVNGRMRGEEAIQMAWDMALRKMQSNEEDGEGEDNNDQEENEDEALMKEFLDSPSKSKVKSEDETESSNNKNGIEKINGTKTGESIKESKAQKALILVVKSFHKLIEGGYIEMVKPIVTTEEMELMHKPQEKQDGIHGGEVEFNLNEDGTSIVAGKKKKKRSRSSSDVDKAGSNAAKKQKVESKGNKSTDAKNNDINADDVYGSSQPDHPEILSLLSTQSLRKLIPQGSVYRVNTAMFHASLRGMALGRLVSEMYSEPPGKNANATTINGNRVNDKNNNNLEHIGSIVTAALTYASRQEHAPMEQILGIKESEEDRHHRMSEWGSFTPSDIIRYLPPDVTKSLQSQVGGILQNISSTLVRMSQFQYPPVVLEVEEARGHPSGGKFEICTRQLSQRLRDRIIHSVIAKHHGLVAARIVSILHVKGHLESDAIAEDAMVPAKEAREILHRLQRDKYINLFDMHVTKTHNSGTAIYLWNVIPSRLLRTVVNNVCTALLNLRLRRQHEVEAGKDWMDRAKEAGATEENTHDEDKKKYHAFCKGLERLDNACLQLDETLMVLKDF